ncbi:neuraminidase-like domain-containing protein [Streptomyces sp. NBC_00572]|uniref:Tc toxin subunit A-related protein n=1 Tax=Streptomyces sp. NBC_00572 TaxID=2903664 RepID=UPI00225BC626|nr:neuraminidase-like domain-containing protein [Streptomyces sp. NBC_00572]MCX4985886.1 neuraminidase-like domain-containing protein [Streptomyces sp. NBC_00572]
MTSAAAPRSVTVQGRVLREDGTPVVGAEVLVSARRLRSTEPVGETRTGDEGAYRLECELPDTAAELVIAATTDGRTTRTTRTVRAFAAAGETVDLRLPGSGPSRYEALLSAVGAHLDGVGLAEVGEEADGHELAYLSRATGHSAQEIGHAAQAARHERSTGLSAERYFGLLARGLPADLAALAQRSVVEASAALAAAAAEGVISSADGAAEFLTALRVRELQAAEAADRVTPDGVTRSAPDGVVPSPLARIFAVAVPEPDVRARLYTAHLDRTGMSASLAGEVDGHAERLELALELGRLTGDNAPLVKALLARFDTGEFTHRRDLVRLDGRWAELVTEAGGVPESSPGPGPGPGAGPRPGPGSAPETGPGSAPETGPRSVRTPDTVREYADGIRTRVAEAYPTAHLAFRLAGHPEHAEAPATRFLAANPDFDLTATRVDATTVPDAEERRELAVVQRTFKIAPRFEAMQALRDNGFHSSYAVAGIGVSDFARKVSGDVDEAEARAIHARATQVHAEAVNLVADLRTAGQFDVPWLPAIQPQTTQIPDWEDLFGSADYAPVEESRSVYSQAAYLVDLLYYLRRLGGGEQTGESRCGPVAEVLHGRRRDLWDIELSKENTEFSIPYVDLVNELLESAVSPETAVPAAERQSRGSSDELRVQPQHVNTGAYDKLRTAVHPWQLPFDLWGEQTTTYLGRLGVTREALVLDLCYDATHPTDFDRLLTAARLGLSKVSQQIIAGETLTPPRTLAEFYGRPAATTDAALTEAMTHVRPLLDTAGLRFTELAAVLETRFVDPGGVVRFVPDARFPNDTDKMTLSGLDASVLERLHRFVRLQHVLGVEPRELDRLIQGSNNDGRLDVLTLRSIAAVRAMCARLDLPAERVLGFCRPLDTHRYPSDDQPPLYDRLFLDPAAVSPQPGTPSPFELNADRSELKVIGSLETPAVSAALLAALQVSDAELAELVTGPNTPLRNKSLNLVNLTVLSCVVTLARTLSLPVVDLLRLAPRSSANPWSHLVASASAAASTAVAPTPSALSAPSASTSPFAETEPAGGDRMRQPGTEAAAGPPLLPAASEMDVLGRFVDLMETFVRVGFHADAIEAVLDARRPPLDGPLPDDAALVSALTSLRAALQTIQQQTRGTTDDRGELTRRNLALMGWDATLVQETVATLLGTVVYTAPLAALPAGVSLPTDLPVRFEPAEPAEGEPVRPAPSAPPSEAAQDRRLSFTGPMNDDQHRILLALAPAGPEGDAFRTAVEALYQGPRRFVTARMKALRIPVFAATLAALPPGYAVPQALAGKVFHDVTAQALRSRGYLSEAEVRLLKQAPGADSFLATAVENLVTAQKAAPEEGNAFLGAADADALFNAKDTLPADRFRLVLERLTPHLRRTLSKDAVVQQIGRAAGLDPALSDALLGTWLPGAGGKPVFEEFLDTAFTGSDPAVVISRAGFGPQFIALELVHRIALVLKTLRFSADELPFVFRYAAVGQWLDLGSLPAAPPTPPSHVPVLRLSALIALARLRTAVPGGIATLTAVFRLATTPGTSDSQIIRELSRLTGWAFLDVNMVARNYQINIAERFLSLTNLDRLRRGVAMYRRLGVSAERANLWLRAEFTPEAAQAAWGAARARHTATDWLAVAGPMQDALRERGRAALVAYLVAHPAHVGTTPLWRDANGLHDHFLLDVEMGAGQQTTRVAQAAYSIQLFVQRCLLNLEPQVSTSDSDLWEQWEWMKRYRLWEANQKIFLYPENYFEPELRADKSSFFGQLETDLTQKDLVDETARGALQNYLEGLSAVARLQPSGVYVDYDLNSPPTDFSGETVYVLARTESAPRTHYFRTWVNRLYWTPWQKVNLDIDGEALSLGMWDRQLYAFWPTFIPAGEAQEIRALPDDTEAHKLVPSPKYWQIQLNWSEYRHGQWTTKRVSGESLHTNPVLPSGWEPDKRYWTYFDPAEKDPYLFVPGSDFYSREPVVWCNYGRLFNVTNTETHNSHSSTVWGRFRLSRRRGTMLAEPMGFSAVRVDQRPPTDPDGQTGVEGAAQYQYFIPPPGQKVLNNSWVEDQIGGEFGRQFCLHDARAILTQTPLSLPFRVVTPHQAFPRLWQRDVLFFTDSERSYLVTPDWQHGNYYCQQFSTFYHPFTDVFKAQLGLFGIDGLFDRDLQLHPERFTPTGTTQSFEERYSPDPERALGPDYPTENVEFAADKPYAVYNWELFFHAPLLMAGRLSTNQRFAEAQRWFHRIFDPTDRSTETSPARYWRTKPFFETSTDPADPDSYQSQRIEEILRRLAEGNAKEAAKVDAWLRHPFQPDVVARLRTTAYQKAVVMKYLDNLIAWGDQLFRQDTLESVNEATQLYILAAELLGRRPEEVTRQQPVPVLSFRELDKQPPAPEVSATESLIPAPRHAPQSIVPGVGIRWLDYFGIPRNEKLLGYWDTVDDRLYKIRHGQNIDGVARPASLFGAEIDPGLLARAASSGLDLSTVLADLNAPVPHYRFATMLAKAKEFAQQVQSFGGALLSALEKRDAEELARLRSTHEYTALDAALEVRKKQLEEARRAIKALEASQAIAKDKELYYAGKAKNRMNPKEQTAADLSAQSVELQKVSATINTLASYLSLIPELKIGAPTSVGATFGGNNLSDAMIGMAHGIIGYLSADASQAQQSATVGGYDHRLEEWQFQKKQADKEAKQFAAQIKAAKSHRSAAQKEVDSHVRLMTNSHDADVLLRGKYTNQELYDWMAGQLGTSYFQAYQLAYDVAKRAERALRHELGTEETDFVSFGHWDSLHRGLLAGERLLTDLHRMDAAYYEANARELELTKRISLAQLDPGALRSLKETGRAYVSLPEALFDLDTPGHYMRRLKQVSFTVPCVVGPYTGVNLTATLLKSSVRLVSRLNGGKHGRQPGDIRFRDHIGPVESVVTSTGQDDAGLFDGTLRDERFLPFEGAGAIGEWQLSLPDSFRRFDYETISDVVMQLRYTARDGGATLAAAAVSELHKALGSWLHTGGGTGLYRHFSARREFPDQWSRFLATPAGSPAMLSFSLSKRHFPYLFHDRTTTLKRPELVLILSTDLAPGAKRYRDCYPSGGPLTVTLSGPGGAHGDLTLAADPALAGQPRAGVDGVHGTVTETDQEWRVTVPAAGIAALAPELLHEGRLNPDAYEDLLLVWQYGVEPAADPAVTP